MKILYGVHGYSRGHATRAAAVLETLVREHDVLILAGPDAHELLKDRFDTIAIPSLRFVYGVDGRISPRATLADNGGLLADLLGHGRSSRALTKRVRAFAPDVAVSDADPWTHRIAARLGVPRVGFDHFGIMVYCDVPFVAGDRLASAFDRFAYRVLMGRPERVLVSSFYPAPPKRAEVRVIGPLLGEEVYEVEPRPGEHLLVYLNNGHHQLTTRLRAELRLCSLPLIVYGAGEQPTDGNLSFRAPSRRGFLEDLASARAVISTAGNQLVGEALFYGRPLLVLPEDTVEQRMNAAAVARLGVGETCDIDALDAARIGRFVEQLGGYEAAARARAVDGRGAALQLLDRWIQDLPREGRRSLVRGRLAARKQVPA